MIAGIPKERAEITNNKIRSSSEFAVVPTMLNASLNNVFKPP